MKFPLFRPGARTLVMLAFLSAGAVRAARTNGGYYTEERLSHAHVNVGQYDWARRQHDEAVKQAGPFANRSDEELWALVPGQLLGRCIDVTFDLRITDGPKRLGCLVCGEKIFAYGNYPYEPDFEHQPWKLVCPSCGAVFPTNDFGRFYESAIDEHGLFDPAKGDRSLLYNTAHPDPKDPLHLFGVDDGSGYVDGNGREHRFIGYYAWKYWMWIYNGTRALAEAYVLSGDQRYAHKAAILLDRIADVYPSMDWHPYAMRGWYHSDGGRGRGKIEGAIWETEVVRKLAEAYDAILSGTVGDRSLVDFLVQQGRRYQLPHPKGTRDFFVQNVDDNLLRCAFQAVLSGRIRANEGLHQLTVATCALALNTEPDTTRWLDWLFAPDGGAIPGLILSRFDRDGMSDEGAPGYALFFGRDIAVVAERLADYPAYTRHNIFREFPFLRATFTAPQRMIVLDRAMPNLGDSGETGLVSARFVRADLIAQGYRYTRDPELAVAAWRANGETAEGLGRDIFDADPEALGREIGRVARTATDRGRPAGGDLMTGYGLALLESDAGTDGFAVACNYGRSLHHAHLDELNFDLFGFGHWLAPDLGYPEFATAWPQRDEWTVNTLSHNTVVVDGRAQERIWGGRARLLSRLPGFRLVQLEAKAAYPGINDYTRTLMLIDAPVALGHGAYVVDLFSVAGGHDHLYSFHGPPGEITAEGLKLAPQLTGTYAGPDVPFATPSGKFPRGYSYLYNVRRQIRPTAPFALDWRVAAGYRGVEAADGLHVKLHVLTPSDDVALADGDPPQNKPGNPRRLGYVLLHRTGQNLESTFISVVEPYRKDPFIKSVERLATDRSKQVALLVEFVDGTTDRVLFDPLSEHPLQLTGGIFLEGEIGYLREKNGTSQAAVLVHGRKLAFPGGELVSKGEIRGRVVKMNRELQGGGWICVDAELPLDGSMTGRQIHIATDGSRDACYTIRGVRPEDGLTRIDCGPITFAHAYRGPNIIVRGAQLPADYRQGFLYDFETGARFSIPLEAHWTAPAKSAPSPSQP